MSRLVRWGGRRVDVVASIKIKSMQCSLIPWKFFSLISVLEKAYAQRCIVFAELFIIVKSEE